MWTIYGALVDPHYLELCSNVHDLWGPVAAFMGPYCQGTIILRLPRLLDGVNGHGRCLVDTPYF